MFSLFLGTPEKIDNTEAAKDTALRSLNLNTNVHTVCKKGIPKNQRMMEIHLQETISGLDTNSYPFIAGE